MARREPARLAARSIRRGRRAMRRRAVRRWSITPLPAVAKIWSAAADLRDQHDLTVRAELRLVGVLEDLAIDRHRHAFIDLMPQAGEAPLELGDHPAHRVGIDIDLGLPAGKAAGSRAGDDDAGHV